MIDLSLTKLALIGVVALVVVGPEKLPKIARMAGALFGRAQRYINDVKSEVSREMALDDLHDLKRDVQAAAQDIQSSLNPLHTAVSEEDVPDAAFASFANKAKIFRRQKMSRASALALIHRQGHKGRAGLRKHVANGKLYGEFF